MGHSEATAGLNFNQMLYTSHYIKSIDEYNSTYMCGDFQVKLGSH